jgi:predicted acylesterase/phospholipase RssA
MSKVHKLQIAIQGGGAKLSALLAAMEAIKYYQDKQTIKVTRVAGTSAGAIAACLFAANTSPEKIKHYFETNRHAFEDGYALPSLAKALFQLGVGKPSPLWSERPLREMLIHFLNKNGYVTFEDFQKKQGIEVQVYATDLVNQVVTIHTGKENIVDSVLNSSGLPYLFRVPAKHGVPSVDGGICENLPIANLRESQGEYGHVVAISFKKSPPRIPNGILGFSLALIDTAITNSVERSKVVLSGPFIHNIETATTTFDFKIALNTEHGGLGEDYRNVYDSTLRYLNNLLLYLNQNRSVAPPHWETTDASAVHVMEEAYRAYLMLSSLQPKKRLRTSFKVTANSLFDHENPRRALDIAQHTNEFLVYKTPVTCLASAINAPPGTPYRGIGDWYIEHNGKRIRDHKNIIVVPARDPKMPRRRRFIFYFEPLEVSDQPYKFVFQDHGDEFMKPLLEGKRDSVGYSCAREDGYNRIVDLILYVPREYRALAVHGGDIGARINERELHESDQCPRDFIAYGWRAEAVPAGKRVYFEIE